MAYALFLGCTIPARSRNYEASARQVCGALGLRLVDIPQFACCGFPIKSMDSEEALTLSAFNLALALREGLDVLTLCSSCGSSLAEAAKLLQENVPLRERVNIKLARIGLSYGGGVKVRHIVHVLHEEVGLETIGKKMVTDLSALRIASHHGCHFLKPSEIHHFDEVEAPRSLDRLTALTSAEPVNYPGKTKCCGGPVMASDPDTAVAVAHGKLNALADVQVDALTLACPFCSVMYESNQIGADSESGHRVELPVLFITQVLGLGMGLSPKDLGFKQNVIKPKALLAKLGL
ncbi:MAG: CoB--CoM heterodisulfide reductase iron-sulfur subunit B family protein [Deltaproteobacteria bacterium]|nr:CoB--CoM heterodisulfide reductase iron-sulfur subunit B family protein [Deltaproteobacteria bacterium]